jgi:hypothetical protein
VQTEWYWLVSAAVVVAAGWWLLRVLGRIRVVYEQHMDLLRRVESTAHMLTAQATAGDLASSQVAGVIPTVVPPRVLVLPDGGAPAEGLVPIKVLVQPPSPLDNVIILDSRRASARPG